MPQGSGGMAQQNLFFVLTSWSFILPWGDCPSPLEASQQELLEVLPSSKVFSLDLMTGLSQNNGSIQTWSAKGVVPCGEGFVTWPWARTHAEEFPLRWGKLQQFHFFFMPLLRLLLGLTQRC